MLTLPGLVLLAAFLIGGGAEALTGNTPTAFAANARHQSETYPQSGGTLLVSQYVMTPSTEWENCPVLGEHRKPSFGRAVEVKSDEVICSDLISFGGPVSISGQVDGNVVTFGGNVVVAGKVNGNVTLYGGNLNLQHDAQVN